ncbi:MAG: hypothetical protein KAJ49_05890 [Arcobacteraceae bacterium]|nr:hypothetical protein [Arcobacteraceae bacterium]
MLVRDNTIQIITTIWIVGAFIIAHIYLVMDNFIGFLIWMIFALVLIIIDFLRMNSELKMIRRRIRFIEREIKRDEEQKNIRSIKKAKKHINKLLPDKKSKGGNKK